MKQASAKNRKQEWGQMYDPYWKKRGMTVGTLNCAQNLEKKMFLYEALNGFDKKAINQVQTRFSCLSDQWMNVKLVKGRDQKIVSAIREAASLEEQLSNWYVDRSYQLLRQAVSIVSPEPIEVVAYGESRLKLGDSWLCSTCDILFNLALATLNEYLRNQVCL